MNDPTPFRRPDIAPLLYEACQLVVQREFDREAALQLLSDLPAACLDVQTSGAIRHARLVLLAGPTSSAGVATARFALARVVALLERER